MDSRGPLQPELFYGSMKFWKFYILKFFFFFFFFLSLSPVEMFKSSSLIQ